MDYYVVDVFTDRLFHGNPAGVCILETPADDALMQKIASENNLPETAFLWKRDGWYDLRWFTPTVEIDLCGHATLAGAYVLRNFVEKESACVEFHTKSGVLRVRETGGVFEMDFPLRKPVPVETPAVLSRALGAKILETHAARDLLVLMESQHAVAGVNPDFSLLREIRDYFGVIITAKGDDCDFVSRFFAPGAGIDEDPVTGSSHCTLIPFWSERLNKSELTARQLSRRGGSLLCRRLDSRVEIGGTARLYLHGTLSV
jgi:PhzF family phenazine biosynthesis protein